MADSIAELLGKRSYDEPEEVTIIKQFVRDRYNAAAGVTLQERQIIITVKGAALAGTLRMHLHELKSMCQTEKRLVIRIS